MVHKKSSISFYYFNLDISNYGSIKLSSNVVVIMIRKYLNPLFDMF